MKIRILYILLPWLLAMASCYEDQSNDHLLPKQTLSVTGVAESYTVTAMKEVTLSITPVIDGPEGERRAWWGLVSEKDRYSARIDTLAHTVELHLQRSFLPGEYTLLYYVEDVRTGLSHMLKTHLSARTEFSKGWWVLKTTEAGGTDVDMFPDEGELIPDVLKAAMPCPLQIDTVPYTRRRRVDEVVDRALLSAYVRHLDLVRFTEKEIEAGPSYRDNIEKEEKSRPSVLKLFASESMSYVKPEDAEVVIHKPNWWVTGGSGSIQFSQSHISKNWYNGGEGTHSLLGNLQLFANYNDREKWQWENLLDAKLGYISAPSDQYHNYLVNNDQLRIASKVGLRAIKHWYYTLHTEFKTQFCNGYGANSLTLNAAFLSPAYWTSGLGMDYKLNKEKVTLSVLLAPITYTMKIVTNPDVDEVSLGLKEGATTAHDFGSQMQANLTWKAFSFLNVTSRFDYLTSYKTVRIEWENTFNFILNRYLSAKLYVYGRFDDGVAPSENGSYFQINENFGFGLNYTW